MATQLNVVTPGAGPETITTTDHGDGIQHHHVGSTFDILVGPLDKLLNWGRSNSAWPFGFGLCCCFIEFISMSAAKFDIARFGSEVIRPSPRQCDVMIISGTLTKKMAPAVVRLFQQMAEPRYVIAMGNCAVSGGIFSGGYSQVDGVDQVLPVDIYLPGCPPRPEALMHSIIELQKRIRTESLIRGRRLQPAIPPGTKVAHPWGAPEQIFRKLYKRFYEEPSEHAAAPARPAAPAPAAATAPRPAPPSPAS
ncbi:MAG: hypothetical protein NVS3B24_19450 [Candidatus Dormibacteria bacterium]